MRASRLSSALLVGFPVIRCLKSKAAAGGIISGRGSDAYAESAPTVEASIGTHAVVDIALVVGDADLTVKAEYFPEADATAKGYGGGARRRIGAREVNPPTAYTLDCRCVKRPGQNVQATPL